MKICPRLFKNPYSFGGGWGLLRRLVAYLKKYGGGFFFNVGGNFGVVFVGKKTNKIIQKK